MKKQAKTPKLTPWFPVQLSPVREGVYETRTEGEPISSGFQYWSGGSWGLFHHTADKAFLARQHTSIFQDNEWRGLAADPKVSA